MTTTETSVLAFLLAGVVAAAIAWRRLPATSWLRNTASRVADSSAHLYPRKPPTVASLQRKALRRMYNEVTVGVGGSVLTPTDFTVAFSADDFERVSPVRAWFVAELGRAFTDHAAAQNWTTPARVNLTITADRSVAVGVVAVTGRFEQVTLLPVEPQRTLIDGPTAICPEPLRRTCVITVDGRKWVVFDGATVGRSSDCDITVDDEAVSRRHCRFHLDEDTWSVEDLGSLNGTRVNAVRIFTRTAVSDGDELGLGAHVTCRVAFHVPVTRAA